MQANIWKIKGTILGVILNTFQESSLICSKTFFCHQNRHFATNLRSNAPRRSMKSGHSMHYIAESLESTLHISPRAAWLGLLGHTCYAWLHMSALANKDSEREKDNIASIPFLIFLLQHLNISFLWFELLFLPPTILLQQITYII